MTRQSAMFPPFRMIVLLAVAILQNGCGLKGPLYLRPPEPAANPASIPKKPASSSESVSPEPVSPNPSITK
jgi:predicted small lipoprotein YifL